MSDGTRAAGLRDYLRVFPNDGMSQTSEATAKAKLALERVNFQVNSHTDPEPTHSELSGVGQRQRPHSVYADSYEEYRKRVYGRQEKDFDKRLLEYRQFVHEQQMKYAPFVHETTDNRMPDGSRFNAIIPPLAIDGSLVSIRKFKKNKMC